MMSLTGDTDNPGPYAVLQLLDLHSYGYGTNQEEASYVWLRYVGPIESQFIAAIKLAWFLLAEAQCLSRLSDRHSMLDSVTSSH
jgi:hypothetical protein